MTWLFPKQMIKTKFNFGFVEQSIAVFLIVLLIGITITAIDVYYQNKTREEVFQTSKKHCANALARLYKSGYIIIEEIHGEDLLKHLTEAENKYLDSLLKSVSRNALSEFIGIEGGFYFYPQEKFLGFSFPTSDPPEPFYGPPPREYSIIRNQLNESIRLNIEKINNYQFSPTVFILNTKPMIFDDNSNFGVYTMMRIESILPDSIWGDYVRVEVILSLIGILIAILISWLLRKRVENIKIGLEQIKSNPSLRLKQEKGILGVISSSINELLDSREKEQIERERLEQELIVKERMASLGNLIAGVTHQVKTPLAIIKSKIQLWHRKISEKNNSIILAETISEASMKDVVEEIDKLTGLVNRLLLFLKNPVKELKQSDLNELIQKVVNSLQFEFQGKNIKVDLSLSDIPKIKIDPSSIEQVIINLLINSIQAIDHNGEIIVSTKLNNENSIIIEISDNGAGIDESIVNKVFEPFFTTKSEGSGLGLSVAYEIIKSHNGLISIKPGKTAGTVCTIILPLN